MLIYICFLAVVHFYMGEKVQFGFGLGFMASPVVSILTHYIYRVVYKKRSLR